MLRIRKIRKALGWTQVQLAERLGVDPNTVARWEREERRPQSEKMLKLALSYLQEHEQC